MSHTTNEIKKHLSFSKKISFTSTQHFLMILVLRKGHYPFIKVHPYMPYKRSYRCFCGPAYPALWCQLGRARQTSLYYGIRNQESPTLIFSQIQIHIRKWQRNWRWHFNLLFLLLLTILDDENWPRRRAWLSVLRSLNGKTMLSSINDFSFCKHNARYRSCRFSVFGESDANRPISNGKWIWLNRVWKCWRVT